MKSKPPMQSTATRCAHGHLWADDNLRKFPKKNKDGTIMTDQFIIQCRTCNNESRRKNRKRTANKNFIVNRFTAEEINEIKTSKKLVATLAKEYGISKDAVYRLKGMKP